MKLLKVLDSDLTTVSNELLVNSSELIDELR